MDYGKVPFSQQRSRRNKPSSYTDLIVALRPDETERTPCTYKDGS